MSMGMMHEGYFVGRKELTAWIQQYFDPRFQKVEELGSGVVYCQILNSIYPGIVPMAKVKAQARTEVDFLHNFRLLQGGFNKKKIDRFIEVDKLTKKSFQFNMEFLQFFKTYWDMHAPESTAGEPVFKEAPTNQPDTKAPVASKPPVNTASAPANAVGSSGVGGPKRLMRPGVGAGAGKVREDELSTEVTELKLHVENLERERDFYYSKLREVEILCQEKEHEQPQVPFLQDVLSILYRMDADEEFQAPESQENSEGAVASPM